MLTNVLLPASYCPRDLIPRICHTGETAINRGLAKRLEQMAKERKRRERAAAAADEEFSAEFLTAARKVFQMIDDDDSGTLEKAEIVLPGVVLIIRELCRTLLRPSTRRHTRLTHR